MTVSLYYKVSTATSVTALLHHDAVIIVPLFEALQVQGLTTSPAHQPCFTLFLQSVITIDTVKLLVLNDGHDTSTVHRLSSAVLVTLAALL